METKTGDIVLAPVLDTPLIVLRADVVTKASALETLAKDAEVSDVFALTGADSINLNIKTLAKEIEAERVRVKAPFMLVCNQIDESCKKITNGLVTSQKLLQGKILVFQQEQERIRQEAETKARIEREAAEAKARAEAAKIEETNRLAREEAARLNRPPPTPVMPTVPKIVIIPADVPQVFKSTSTTTVTRKVLVIDDLTKIPLSIAGVNLLEPINKNIEKLLKAGVEVPGCRLEEKTESRSL